jgi:hypothetical protein
MAMTMTTIDRTTVPTARACETAALDNNNDRRYTGLQGRDLCVAFQRPLFE